MKNFIKFYAGFLVEGLIHVAIIFVCAWLLKKEPYEIAPFYVLGAFVMYKKIN